MNRIGSVITRIGVPLLTLGLLGVYFSRQVERSSPGELSGVHALQSELRGAAGCELCHGDGTDTGMTLACLACHERIRGERAETAGFHGRLSEVRSASCATCHHEHRGTEHPPTTAQSWAKAGITNWRQYDHAGLDFRLDGAHLGLDCTRCHANSEVAVLAKGKHRFLMASQACDTCHADPHEGKLGEECASCHGQVRPFPEVAAFVHDARFALTLGHAGQECRACHARSTPSSLEEIAQRRQPGPVRACQSCHVNPHDGTSKSVPFLPRSENCSSCHDTASFRAKVFGVAEHAAIGVALEGVHARAACTKCHSAASTHTAQKSRKSMNRCEACHASPHSREFVTGSTGATCVACHDGGAASFQVGDHLASRQAHAAIGIDLGPPHEKAKCSSCHPPAATVAAFAARYPGRAMASCELCHGDPHRGQLRDSLRGQLGCRACHDPKHFSPTTFGIAEHQRTRLPLDGAHAATSCDRCHPQMPATGAQPATRRFRPVSNECAACHSDPHRGAFAARTLPEKVGGRTGCARCHVTSSFSAVAKDFDHALWTGYQLVGAHATAACAACHPSRAQVPASPLVMTRAPKACSSCHDDPHGGQFANLGESGCSKCHDPRNRFSHTSFSHDRDARFRLDATHAKLSCSACHREYRTASGASIVRYKPLGLLCADCHDTRQGRFR